MGRNDVASASRCDWLHGLSSRRSKPRLDPDGLLSLPALAKTLTAERLPTPHGATVWTGRRCSGKGKPAAALPLFRTNRPRSRPDGRSRAGRSLLQRTRVEGTLPPGLGSATPRVVKRSASHAIKSGPSRRGVPLPPEVAHYWAQSKTTRPDQAASRWAALTGRPGAFELHWIAGGRPLAVRGAVGVCLGRNDVAGAGRCDWRTASARAVANRSCRSGTSL